MNLFDISKDFFDLMNQISDNGGEVTPELEAALAVNEENFQEKVTNYARAIAHRKSEIAYLDNQIKLLNQLKKQKDKSKSWLEDTLSAVLLSRGIRNFDALTTKVSFRKSSSVEVIDETLVPDEYWTTKEVKSVSKSLIREALDAGHEVPGTTIKESNSIQVKSKPRSET